MSITCRFLTMSEGNLLSLLVHDLPINDLNGALLEVFPTEEFEQQICAAALRCSQIRAINLIFDRSQFLYFKRGAEISYPGFFKPENRDSILASYIDPEESAISQAIDGFEATLIDPIRKILTLFLNNSSAAIISLSFEDGQGGVKTQSWKKAGSISLIPPDR